MDDDADVSLLAALILLRDTLVFIDGHALTPNGGTMQRDVLQASRHGVRFRTSEARDGKVRSRSLGGLSSGGRVEGHRPSMATAAAIVGVFSPT